ncbi:hypothetical protein A2U01_0093247, partial [Trifolium medium]|nr:hypothetical protein [Trifolium medium]
EEEKPATGEQEPKQVAMSIWRPEDFYVSEDVSAEFSAAGRIFPRLWSYPVVGSTK